MPTKRASYQLAEFKAVNGAASGEFTALVSVFGNVDQVGDRVMPGSFKNSLAKWKQSGDPIPIIWSHDWQDPFAHIGYVTSAQEVPAQGGNPPGLLLSGKNDIEKPFAKQVHDLLVARRVKNWSFAYDVINEHRAKDGANELDELGLIEAGPTLVGANTSTDTINAKALLDAAAAKELEPFMTSLPSRKTYIDADMPGTFEDIRDRVGDAATALLNPTNDDTVWVCVQATYPTYALVEVQTQGDEDDVTYQIPFTTNGEEVELGTPVAVEVAVTVTPKSAGAKAGARLSQATKTQMQAARDKAASLVTDIDELMGVAEEDTPKASEAAGAKDAAADLDQVETPDSKSETEGLAAKSPDASVSAFLTRVSEMRALTGTPA